MRLFLCTLSSGGYRNATSPLVAPFPLFNKIYDSDLLIVSLSADVKSMVSTGLATILLSNGDIIKNAIHGKQNIHILCIGHGGGSIPLFLARKIQGSKNDPFAIDDLINNVLNLVTYHSFGGNHYEQDVFWAEILFM